MSCSLDVFALQVKEVAQGRLQGEQVGPGGPQQVGKHPTDLGHVLNQAKALNPDTKLVFYTIVSQPPGCVPVPGLGDLFTGT